MKKREKVKRALLIGAGTAAGLTAAKLLTRGMINKTHDHILKILMEDTTTKTCGAGICRHTATQNIIETNLRATEGKAIAAPWAHRKISQPG